MTASPKAATLTERLMIMSLIDSLALTTLRAQGFSSRYHSTTGGDVHMMEAEGQGDGPPILMLHGLGSCSADYFFLMPALRRKARRIFTLDFPGHGASELPSAGMSPPVLERALLEVADELLTEPMVVFGNSLGGLVALKLAINRPDRVQRLLLASPAGAPMTDRQFIDFVDGLRPQSHAEAVLFVDRFMARRTRLRHVLAWGVRQRFGSKGVVDLLERIGPEHMLTAEQLQALAMPIWVFWGEHDRILPTESREFYRNNLPPHAHFEDGSGFGHAPYLDHPLDFAKRLLRQAA